MQKIVRIIPAPAAEYGEPHLCNGTKVLLSDGQELIGITAMTIRAEAGNVWRAEIEVLAHPDEISDVVAQIRESGAEARTVAGAIVIECAQQPTVEGIQYIRAQAERAWPHREVLILPPGVRVSHDERLDKIEALLEKVIRQTRKPDLFGGPC